MAEEYEKKTPVFDWEKGDFAVDPQKRIVTVTGNLAVEQIVIKAQQTKRAIYPIYADTENPDQNHKYGTDAPAILSSDLSEEARLAELKRACQDAIVHDPWVKEVTGVNVQRDGSDAASADLTVKTIFDTEVTVEGVNLNNA